MEDIEEAKNTRIETGAVQFDDDWHGIFIRGDNAMFYSLIVKQAVEQLKKDKSYSIIDRIQLEALADLLHQCDERIEENKTLQKISIKDVEIISK